VFVVCLYVDASAWVVEVPWSQGIKCTALVEAAAEGMLNNYYTCPIHV
jgi:hypothetical protein